MKYSNSILNHYTTKCDIYDDNKLKLFTGRVSNVSMIIKNMSQHNCYIIAAESDINRLEDGDLIFSVGDKLVIGEIVTYGDAPRTYVQAKYNLVWIGDKFVVIDE